MSFLENLALVGTAATILGVFLTGYAIVNNKTLKKESRLTREAIAEESRLTREAVEMVIKEESRLTREVIAEESRLTREMIKETTKYLGDLIIAKGST
jgi:hypothetical protein